MLAPAFYAALVHWVYYLRALQFEPFSMFNFTFSMVYI